MHHITSVIPLIRAQISDLGGPKGGSKRGHFRAQKGPKRRPQNPDFLVEDVPMAGPEVEPRNGPVLGQKGVKKGAPK